MNSRKKPLIYGSLASTVFLSMLLYMPPVPYIWIYVLLFTFGVASSVEILVFPIACENSPHTLAGTASALTNMIVMLGGAIVPPLVGLSLDYTWQGQLRHGTPLYSNFSYEIALSILPISLFIGFLFSLLLKETHCEQQETSNPKPFE